MTQQSLTVKNSSEERSVLLVNVVQKKGGSRKRLHRAWYGMPSDKSETLTLSLPQQGTIQAEVYDKNNDNSSTSEINASQTVSGLELEYKGPEKADPNEVSLRPK